jgi:hypothetical protein
MNISGPFEGLVDDFSRRTRAAHDGIADPGRAA